jgi:hypothetical protein
LRPTVLWRLGFLHFDKPWTSSGTYTALLNHASQGTIQSFNLSAFALI